ncbi:hypothetical protein [Streptosporangium roseum]|uniref:hypothetical protein n=1 Tax=Streptosporangium roseum TaxID=2001 RepID=UPI0011D222D9|nr:hypothetical protein [Streptosporangium roseum]
MARHVLPILLGLAVLSGCGSEGTLSQAALDQARAQGVAPDLIYVVDLPGYELAEQSVGGVGGEGFGAFYVSPEGGQVELRTDRGTFSDALCADTPVKDAEPAAAVRCERDEVGWYRVAGDHHEYTVVSGDHYIRLNGRVGEADRAALKAAVAGARHVTGEGSGTPLPSRTPVERGDLPTNGDSAPDNDAGAGG